ncbi:hypothetical protein FFWV33_11770 [Flavobacterium faecale]|uniref:Uncharacterized protein n=1 Tax=Flavobacterium faecale TaxID=1355330 RepID=A0A2S1LEE8_9FLAO|nr:hypothetical protein FFWV33_11770 [Flavobacterium faecale]
MVFLSSIPKKRDRIWKREKLNILQEKLKVKPQIKVAKESKIRKSQCCKTGNLHTILLFDQRGPPVWYLGSSHKLPVCKN